MNILDHITHLPDDGQPYEYEIVFDSHNETVGCRMRGYGCCPQRAREQFEQIHKTWRVISVDRVGASEAA